MCFFLSAVQLKSSQLGTSTADDSQEMRSILGEESQPAQSHPPQPVQHPPSYIGYTQPVQQQTSNTVSLWSLATAHVVLMDLHKNLRWSW